MPGLDLLKRLRLMAGLTGMRAPGRKTAAGLGIDGRNQFTLDQNALGRIVNIHRRDRREQRLGIGMKGLFKQLLRITGLHQLSQIHNADLMRDMPHHRQVMCDEHIGQSQLILQVHQ